MLFFQETATSSRRESCLQKNIAAERPFGGDGVYVSYRGFRAL